MAIAELLEGDWPEHITTAMLTIEGNKSDDEDGIGVMILTDIKQAFADKKVDRIFSQDLVDYLIDIDDRPWCEWRHGQPMTKMTLSKLLRPFSIKPKDIRVSYTVSRGYTHDVFKDAFSRYLPFNPSQGATVLQANDSRTFSVVPCELEGGSNS